MVTNAPNAAKGQSGAKRRLNAYWVENLRVIWRTRNRFLAILLISMLGVAFYSGIRAASPDMRLTVDRYYRRQRMMDVQVMSTMGLVQDDLDALAALPGVSKAEAGRTADFLLPLADTGLVVRVQSLPGEDGLNQPLLVSGRMPQADYECVVDADFLKLAGLSLGDRMTLASGNEDDLKDTLARDTFTIVGEVNYPQVLSRQKGSSSIGSGMVDALISVSMDAFSLEPYTEINLRYEDAQRHDAFTAGYSQQINALKAQIQQLAPSREQARYDALISDARKELDEAKQKLLDGEREREQGLEDALVQLTQARQQLLDGERELLENEQKFADEIAAAQNRISQGRRQLREGQALLDEQRKTLEEGEAALAEGQAQLDTQMQPLEQTRQQLAKAREQWQQGQDAWAKGQQELGSLNGQIAQLEQDPDADAQQLEQLKQQAAQLQTQLDESKQALSASQAELEQGEAQLADGLAQLEQARVQLEKTGEQLRQGRAELEAAQIQLDATREQLEQGQRTLDNQRSEGETKLADARKTLEQGRKDYQQGLEDYQREERSSQKELDEAREKILKAEAELADVALPEWYVLTREDNASYASYRDDTDRVTAIGRVFPIIFFLVAVFVTLTSMTRMVEEDRAKIGTFMALGYSDAAIAMKYLYYALLACIIGSAAGLAVGLTVFPRLIAGAYGMLYTSMPPIMTPLDVQHALGATVAAILATAGSAFLSCRASLRRYPARLMRPKSPRPGKRILLERAGWLWKRLSFTQKSTLRNTFRYKKRFIMTIIGIGGCTALLMTGFGLKDSITAVIDRQFSNIWKYDLLVGMQMKTPEDRVQMDGFLAGENTIEHAIYAYQAAVDASADPDGKVQEAYLYVPEQLELLPDMIALRARRGGVPITLESGGVVITEKLSELLGIRPGDAITLADSDRRTATVTVSAITENYPNHYVYMTPQDYAAAFGGQEQPNVMLANLRDSNKTQREALIKRLLAMKPVLRATFAEDSMAVFSDMNQSLDSIIWVLIASAAALAFVVTFILTSINISERQRELATLKVLGFTDREVAASVYRENTLLTLIGIVIGLGAGVFLHRYVMGTAEMDMLMFGRDVYPVSYLYAALLTALFSGLVNLVMRRTLGRIDMVESLKSIE